MKIALFSPLKNAPSETFIQAHRELLEGQVLYYHTGAIPKYLEENPLQIPFPKLYRVLGFVRRQLGLAHTPIIDHSLERSLKQEKPDVIFAEFGVCGAVCTPIAKRLGIPLITHYHGYDASEYDILKKYEKEYKAMFDYASAIIVVSQVMKEKLKDLGAPEQKLVLTHYGAHASFKTLQLDLRPKRFLAVGRMVDKKAPHLLILAFHRCLQYHPDATLVYIGTGPMLRVVQDLVKHLGMEKNVELKGLAGRDVIQAEMQRVRCFVQHSRTAENGDMEGTPVAIIESQSAGLPVISTIHAGIPDVVVHEETGFLVEEGDVGGMAAYMTLILNDAERAVEMGAAGKSRIAAHFTMDHHIQALNDVVKTVVGEK
jgi:glycosyltransferase involved in cell wall biosynthesis